MPLFEEDPAHLSKSRLKSDLVAHSVALPPATTRKDVYVRLHSKHVNSKTAAEFSSDEEDQAHDGAETEPEDGGILDPGALSDGHLKRALLERGVKAGPIVASTRALYEKKLRKLLQADGQDAENGVEKDVIYSDSEEEEEEEEEGPEGAEEEPIEQLDQAEVNQRAHTSRNKEPCSKENSGNLLKVSERSSSHCSQIPGGPPVEPVEDILKDAFPCFKSTPMGIYVTCRKPIKGAAGRPIRTYPDPPPATPTATTLVRQEVERRPMPIHIQIAVFLLVVVLLYLIYICAEDNSFNPLLALLGGLNQALDGEEDLLLQAETRDAPSTSG
ncbi:LEM domain-containing protein 1 [Brachionichthys hirsutus]|uniref:LEM domain-containing protein 1 n=1 Tax=Brachionichthys hirsutus TaxID=412623 RepID=UPI003604DA1B